MWLSQVDAMKKVGSLVVWLKDKLNADCTLRAGTALSSANGAFCSLFILTVNCGLWYYCNMYGHKQTSCTSNIRCAVSLEGHRRDERTDETARSCELAAGIQARRKHFDVSLARLGFSKPAEGSLQPVPEAS